MSVFDYLASSWPELLQLTLQHIWLVGIAVGCAIVAGVPLGILINRHDWLAGPLLGVATIVLTLPSIALFGLMIPLFSRFGQDRRRPRDHGRVPVLAAADHAQHVPRAAQRRCGHQGSRHRHRHDVGSACGSSTCRSRCR